MVSDNLSKDDGLRQIRGDSDLLAHEARMRVLHPTGAVGVQTNDWGSSFWKDRGLRRRVAKMVVFRFDCEKLAHRVDRLGV